MAEKTRTEDILGAALVEASKSFTGLADAVLTKVTERGTTADVVEVVANYLDGYDALDDDNIALIHRAQATAGQPTEPTEADPDLDDLFTVAHAFYIGDGDEHGIDAQELVGMLVDELVRTRDSRAGLKEAVTDLNAELATAEDEVVRLRALVGGRPAAPTRDQLIGVLSEAMYAWAGLSDSEMAEHLEDAGEVGYLADAVMPLLEGR